MIKNWPIKLSEEEGTAGSGAAVEQQLHDPGNSWRSCLLTSVVWCDSHQAMPSHCEAAEMGIVGKIDADRDGAVGS